MYRFFFALALTACATPMQPTDTAADTGAQDAVAIDVSDAGADAVDSATDAPETGTDVVTDVPCYMNWFCNGQCTNLLNDMQNCSGCGRVCRGDYCMLGACFCDGSVCP